jgi:hypothetical protein
MAWHGIWIIEFGSFREIALSCGFPFPVVVVLAFTAVPFVGIVFVLPHFDLDLDHAYNLHSLAALTSQPALVFDIEPP